MRFVDELIAMRDANHSRNHPFFEKWCRGELTKEQTAIYCTQHYHYVSDYLDWMAYEASKVPHRDAKAFLFENLGDEENPDDRHLDMIKDYVAASGMDRNCLDDYPVLPSTEALQNWGWRVVYQRSWQAALAAMFVGLESQFLGICQRVVPALHEHYGYEPGAREIRFFAEHIEADALHGSKGLALVEKYCNTLDLQQQAIVAVRDATVRRWRYMNGIYWFALCGKDDDTPREEGAGHRV